MELTLCSQYWTINMKDYNKNAMRCLFKPKFSQMKSNASKKKFKLTPKTCIYEDVYIRFLGYFLSALYGFYRYSPDSLLTKLDEWISYGTAWFLEMITKHFCFVFYIYIYRMVIICWSGVTTIFLLFAMEQLCSRSFSCGRYGWRSACLWLEIGQNGVRIFIIILTFFIALF